MLGIYLLINIVVVVALLGLGLTVLIKNSTTGVNRTFAVFVLSASFWMMSNYISNDIGQSSFTVLIANHAVFLFSLLAALYLLDFVIKLTADTKSANLLKRFLLPTYAVALLTLTPQMIDGVERQGGVFAVHFGILAPLYFVNIMLLVLSTFFVMHKGVKRLHGQQRGRVRTLLKTLYWTMPVILMCQFVLPAITGWFGLTNVGTVSMLILVFGLYYGVIKHKMFDLRLIVLRSVVYLLSIGVVSGLYSVGSYYLTKLVSDNSSHLFADIVNVVLIIAAITSYAPLRKAFNGVTNSLFYRDAYDTQELLNDMNAVLLNNADNQSLVSGTVDAVVDHIKVDKCFVGLEDSYKGYRTFGDVPDSLRGEELFQVMDKLKPVAGGVVVTDEMEGTELHKLLRRHNVAAVSRMSLGGDEGDTITGYLFIGEKKSGNSLIRQDLDAIRIISGELALAMQSALRFERIEQFNIGLENKVKEATFKLRKTNEKLLQMDETKDEFISMASHQLRTPLTSVKGYVSMVLEGDAGPLNDMQRKLLDQAFISSQRMVFLIADLLNVSRLRTGKFVIESAPVNLAQVIEGEVAQLKETAAGRGLELIYEAPKDFPTLMLDETKTRQVIMNFIDNAIYYTPSGGHVTVTLTQTDKSIEFTVSDDGIGVPRHEQAHLFTKFFRAGNARKARPDGTGLGLFMAKKVIVAQGGATIFKSKEGKGSTFGFIFAKAKLLPPEIDFAPQDARV